MSIVAIRWFLTVRAAIAKTFPSSIDIQPGAPLTRTGLVSRPSREPDSSQLHYSLYHDRYRRTSDGWKFTERVYEIRYLDTSPLAGTNRDRLGIAR